MNITAHKLELKRTKRPEVAQPRGATRSILLIFGLVGIAVFGLQIWMSGEIATAGELISDYETKKEELLLENARLKDSYGGVASLKTVEEQAAEMGFVKAQPQQVHYVHTLESFAVYSEK